MAENYSECYHCPPVHPLLNKLTPYDLGEDFGRARSVEGRLDGVRRRLRDDVDGRPAQRPAAALRPRRDRGAADLLRHPSAWNLIVSVHPDYVLTHHATPVGPNRSIVHCDLYVDGADLGRVDVSGAVEFWDITNREDYHVVEMQQPGSARGAGRTGATRTRRRASMRST